MQTFPKWTKCEQFTHDIAFSAHYNYLTKIDPIKLISLKGYELDQYRLYNQWMTKWLDTTPREDQTKQLMKHTLGVYG